MLFVILITIYLTILSFSKSKTLKKWTEIGLGMVIIGLYLYGLYKYLNDFQFDEFKKDLIRIGLFMLLPAAGFFIVRMIKRKWGSSDKDNEESPR